MSECSAILPVYRRASTIMQRGEGVYLYDNKNNKYLDFASGIAVNSLGHGHPKIKQALQLQSEKLWHCSNLFHNAPLIEFSQKLVNISFADSIFCCSSGAEAVESAIKFMRRYHKIAGDAGRYRIIVADGGFHGRTMGALSAGSSAPEVVSSYAPLLDGFDRVAFNDIDALESAITSETAAIMLEPIQGEGGVRAHSKDYIQYARKLCDEHGLLLCLDEVQCGMGRVGTLFAYEQYDIIPDIVTVGKGIGNGYPLAACLMKQKIADVMNAGCHGSTYGSNPLAMAVGCAVLDILMDKEFLRHVSIQGNILRCRLKSLLEKFPQYIDELRGEGLMLGLKTKMSAYALAERLRSNGLLVAPAGGDIIRILPPLIITEQHSDEAVDKMVDTLKNWH